MQTTIKCEFCGEQMEAKEKLKDFHTCRSLKQACIDFLGKDYNFNDDNYSVSEDIVSLSESLENQNIIDFCFSQRTSESDGWVVAETGANIKNVGFVSMVFDHDVNAYAEDFDELVELLEGYQKTALIIIKKMEGLK